MPTTKVLTPASARASTAAKVPSSSRQLVGPSGSLSGSQQFPEQSKPSMLMVQVSASQRWSALQFGPPSVAKSTYLSPVSCAPSPSAKYSPARTSAAAVGGPPAGWYSSSAVNTASAPVVPVMATSGPPLAGVSQVSGSSFGSCAKGKNSSP